MAANAQRAVALDVPSSSQESSVDEEDFEDASSDASSSYEELQNQAAARRNAVAEAFDVLLAVRATRATRSKVDGAGTGPPVRKHRFLIERTGALDTVTVLKVVTKTGELVPATSLCEFVQQAAAEQIEVYREFQRRGRIPLELPIDAPSTRRSALSRASRRAGASGTRTWKHLSMTGRTTATPATGSRATQPAAPSRSSWTPRPSLRSRGGRPQPAQQR